MKIADREEQIIVALAADFPASEAVLEDVVLPAFQAPGTPAGAMLHDYWQAHKAFTRPADEGQALRELLTGFAERARERLAPKPEKRKEAKVPDLHRAKLAPDLLDSIAGLRSHLDEWDKAARAPRPDLREALGQLEREARRQMVSG
jgi:hypothetical protein